jgi:uncharacterized protein with PIN domain
MNAPLTPADVRFAADRMLQSLATGRRLLGYDCVNAGAEAYALATAGHCCGGVSLCSRALLEQAAAEGRVFLTRNAHLFANVRAALLRLADLVPTAGENPTAQLREIIGRFALDTTRFAFSRCVQCDKTVGRIERAKAAGAVPTGVLVGADELRRCPALRPDVLARPPRAQPPNAAPEAARRRRAGVIGREIFSP